VVAHSRGIMAGRGFCRASTRREANIVDAEYRTQSKAGRNPPAGKRRSYWLVRPSKIALAREEWSTRRNGSVRR